MDRSRVAVIIPAFNEAETIGQVVISAADHGIPIVVNDGSTDSTGAIARRAGAVVVESGFNLGYDAALNSGFSEAYRLGFDIMITLDADAQHDPVLLHHFIRALKSGAKVVVGHRNRKGRWSEEIFGCYTKRKYGIIDPLCGLKGYRREVYEAIGFFDSYKSVGTELMLRSLASGIQVKQIPFTVNERLDSPRFGSIFSANIRVLRALLVWILTYSSTLPRRHLKR